MRSGNPALRDNTFSSMRGMADTSGVMTVSGTVNKTLFSILLCIASASWTWAQFFSTGNPQSVMPWLWGGMIGGFIVALVTIFKKEWAGFTTPAYAVLEGFFLGAISSVFEAQYPGIVIQAVGLTFGTMIAMLFTYKTG